MMKKLFTSISVLALLASNASAQSLGTLGNLLSALADGSGKTEAAEAAVAAISAAAEPDDEGFNADVLKQQKLSQWGIPAANYSGITPIGGDRYVVVSDKETSDGFYVWRITQDPQTGKVLSVENEGFRANKVNPDADRDCEGVVYFPDSDCVFISGEGDQRIIEYNLNGQRTGRELEVPAQFKSIVGNYGFEALAFGGKRGHFWTTTESTLPADGQSAGPAAPGVQNVLRIQSFGKNLQAHRQYAYRMDAGRGDKFGQTYVFGTPSLCVLPGRTLLVLEREANIPKAYVGSEVNCKLYRVKPKRSYKIDENTSLSELKDSDFLEKTLVARWSTKLTVTKMDWANYEGMCLGIKLNDGRQTILLVNDSQGGYGKGPIRLNDYIKVIVLD